MRAKAINLIAETSLAIALALVMIWASQSLPEQLRIHFRWLPAGSTLGFGAYENSVELIRASWFAEPIGTSTLANNRPSRFIVRDEDSTGLRPYSCQIEWTGGMLFEGKPGPYLTVAGRCRLILIPYGLLLLAFSILPAIRWLPALIRLVHRRFTAREGCCPACGYDLRASSGRCPECGTPIRVKMEP